MNKLKIFLTAALLGAFIGARATDIADRLFPYPEVPEELQLLNERTNFLVSHFWDRCHHDSAIKQRDRYAGAFADWVSFMPYADADVVHQSIDALLERFAKQPDNLLALAELAEATFYTEGCEYPSDELFVSFARPVVDNKKIPSIRKARLAHELKLVENTLEGKTIPNLDYEKPDGTKGRLLDDVRGRHTLIFFNDPTCEDCALVRVRLSADPDINSLIDDGQLHVVNLYPGEPDEEWRNAVAGYNRRWIVGASEEIDEIFDLRYPPVLYYIAPDGRLLGKGLEIEPLLQGFHEAKVRSGAMRSTTQTTEEK